MTELTKTTFSIKAANKDLDKLKKHFSHCFDKNGNFDFEKFKKELSKNKDLDFSKESYGMDWLGKSYARLLASDEATTLLKEDEVHNQKDEHKKSENLLIKGDNLEVLKHLSNAYYEKIKMIYIDPPYNTGGDGFVYQDDRKFTKEELQELAGIDEEKSKRILDFTQSKSNSHSAWLTFMYPRLYIAKQLLKDDGVIFISIDDNEVAQLRILMDDIFGEENFVGCFVWQTKNAARGVPPTNMLMENHEYVLTYSKSKEKHTFLGIERSKKDFSNPDNDPRGLWRSESIKATGGQNNTFRIIDPATQNIFEANWAFSESKIEQMIEHNLILFPSRTNQTPRQKKFYDSYRNERKAFVTNLGWHSTENSTKYLMDLFENKKIFNFPKPVDLISFIVKQQTSENDIILDLFAGSGTTADAVMQLNSEDGGNRKYILVQLPELIDEKKNKTAYDFVQNLKSTSPAIAGTPQRGEFSSFPSLRGGKTEGFDGVDDSPKPDWQKKSLFPFWTLPKNKELTQRAKELRKQGILSEVLFWQAFKDKEKIKGYDIDRQVIIGNFIVDFLIAELGLVIEIDGSSHNEKQDYDEQRESFLNELDLLVVRYSDNAIKQNIDGVYQDFLQKIEDRERELSSIKQGGYRPRPSDTPQEGNCPPTIFDITKERLIRAAKKIQQDNQNSKESKDLSGIDFGFKLFETIENNQGAWQNYQLKAKEFSNEIPLFDESHLSDQDLHALLTTWKTYDNIALTQSLETINLEGYQAYYGKGAGEGKLYLVNKGFETNHLKALLEKIDSEESFQPKTIFAFGYHFESKALREISENVKSYNNKKKLDIEFINRY